MKTAPLWTGWGVCGVAGFVFFIFHELELAVIAGFFAFLFGMMANACKK